MISKPNSFFLLSVLQVKKRPSTDFMEIIQKDINASMRAILIDWLVEVTYFLLVLQI